MFAGSFVHPHKKQVLAVAPEPIVKQDGQSKNDCEQNASARFLKNFRKDHPNLNVTIVADALFAKAPTIKLANELDLNFIINVKPKDHKYLFESFKKKSFFAFLDETFGCKKPIIQTRELKDNGKNYKFRFANSMPLNQSSEFEISFIECTEISSKGSKTFTWITNHKITQTNVFKLMQAARARWKIENETFNTLKNQGYNFEHNYGHGKKNLANNMAVLMMLAFLIDQIQEICCEIFQNIKDYLITRKAVWECIRSFFTCLKFDSWHALLLAIRDDYSTA